MGKNVIIVIAINLFSGLIISTFELIRINLINDRKRNEKEIIKLSTVVTVLVSLFNILMMWNIVFLIVLPIISHSIYKDVKNELLQINLLEE